MEKQINIKIILDRIMRHPLMQDLSFETAVDYTLDFLRIVGIPKTFEEKVETVEVKNYRALLPCDLVEIIQVRDSSNDYCLRASTDTFHEVDHESYPPEYTFKVQGDIIYVNFKEGELDIAYRSIPVDEEGYPTIPDNPVYLRALETYIKKQWFTILFDLGRIHTAALQNVQQEYAFYAGQVQSRMILPTLSEMESITNSWNTLLHRTNEFRTGFKNNGRRELLKLH